jgi:5,10-methylenetetrahydromethanopterin reductase
VRIGRSLIGGGPGADTIERLRARVRRAADEGFSSAWTAQAFGQDALTALAAVGQHVDGIELGTAVVPTYPRHPVTLAQQALTTQDAIGGRLTLGIGLSHRVMMEGALGYPFERPARHMREYLSVLMPLLENGSVSYRGETLRAEIQLSVPDLPRVSVLLAALAPRMVEMAGSIADGTVLAWTGRRTIRERIVPAMREAAERAGRPAPRVVCILPVCVTDDVAPVREGARKVFAGYGQLPSYAAVLDSEGVDGPEDLVLAGDEAAVTELLDEFQDAGVTDFVAGEFARGEDRDRTRAFLSSLVGRR